MGLCVCVCETVSVFTKESVFLDWTSSPRLCVWVSVRSLICPINIALCPGAAEGLFPLSPVPFSPHSSTVSSFNPSSIFLLVWFFCSPLSLSSALPSTPLLPR